MRRTIQIILLSLITGVAYADLRISTCRQASDRYKGMAVIYDELFSKFLQAKVEDRPEIGRQIIRIHEDYKDKEYKRLKEAGDKFIDNKQMTIRTAETWKNFMEASIDLAYTIPGENLKMELLGRSEDHYARRIYDQCIGFK